MTAFFLGIRYACDADVVMDVLFTEKEQDYDTEYEAARVLLERGCVVIGQYGDCEAMATLVQLNQNYGNRDADNAVCSSVCFNIDMLHVGYDTFLVSAVNNWGVYFSYLFGQFTHGHDIETDWVQGLETDAVGLSTCGRACAGDTQAQIQQLKNKLVSGEIRVFDTATFTVEGEHLTSHLIHLDSSDGGDRETILTDQGISYFAESTLRSAPYFDLHIDGINWLN